MDASRRVTSGTSSDRFTSAREAFDDNFAKGRELGAALSIVVDGEPVVDVWGGEMRDGVAWREDTMCCAFSIAKAVTATAIAALIDRGELELDRPVATWWPEFGQAGKEGITLRHVLTHRAGTNWFPEYPDTVSMDSAEGFTDLDAIAERIAAAPPVWEPDTRVGYTSLTLGWIASALVRRVSGKSLAAFVRDEVCGPLQATDCKFGVEPGELDRVVDLVPDDAWTSEFVQEKISPDTPAGRGLALAQRSLGEAMRTLFNDDEFRQAEQGAINLITTARDLARVFAVWAGRGSLDGVRLFSEATAEEFMREQTSGDDAAIGTPLRLGLVFWKSYGPFEFGPSDEAVAHIGLGGAVAIADPARQVSIAYLPRLLRVESVAGLEPRLRPVVSGVYDALD